MSLFKRTLFLKNVLQRPAFVFLPVLFLVLPANSPATTTLSLMTYNIHAGIPMGYNSQTYTSTLRDLGNLADVITSAGADLVALQEVHCELGLDTPQRRPTSALNQPRVLAGRTGLNYVFGSTLDDAPSWPENTGYLEWGTLGRWTNNGAPHGEFGNAVLSRFELEGTPENFPLPMKGKQERRACLRLKLRGLPVVVYATHLHHQSPPTRVAQMTEILKRAGQETSGTTVFIMGDMNARPGEKNGDVVRLAARHGFRDLHGQAALNRFREAEPTCPADKPDVRIDYIFCNSPRPVLIEKAEVLPTLASDHRPVLVRISLGD